MLLYCSHGIHWDKSCSKCEVEENIWDITSIAEFERLHRRMGNSEVETLAMRSWEDLRKRWYEYHDGPHDIGGEA